MVKLENTLPEIMPRSGTIAVLQIPLMYMIFDAVHVSF